MAVNNLLFLLICHLVVTWKHVRLYYQRMRRISHHHDKWLIGSFRSCSRFLMLKSLELRSYSISVWDSSNSTHFSASWLFSCHTFLMEYSCILYARDMIKLDSTGFFFHFFSQEFEIKKQVLHIRFRPSRRIVFVIFNYCAACSFYSLISSVNLVSSVYVFRSRYPCLFLHCAVEWQFHNDSSEFALKYFFSRFHIFS